MSWLPPTRSDVGVGDDDPREEVVEGRDGDLLQLLCGGLCRQRGAVVEGVTQGHDAGCLDDDTGLGGRLYHHLVEGVDIVLRGGCEIVQIEIITQCSLSSQKQ